MPRQSPCHTCIVPGVAVLAAVLCEYTGLDLRLSRHFFDAATESWPYKEHWLTQNLLHIGGRNLVVAMAGLLALLLMVSFFWAGLKPYRKDLSYVLIAGLSGPALIGALKVLTHIYSPWDLQLFGGRLPYVRIFDMVPPLATVGHAFPAAHAGGGFAWFSLYFALRQRGVTWSRFSLAIPLTLGVVFGLAQQARGAHFFSHDLFALAICWACSAAWAALFFASDHDLSISGVFRDDTVTNSHKVHT